MEPRLPHDWNDHSAWDRYYAWQLSQFPPMLPDSTGSISLDQLPDFAKDLKANGWRSVWVPGCGLSPLPRLLAHLGLQVTASDMSAIAIQHQREADAAREDLVTQLGPADTGGSLTTEVHDFRTMFRKEAFDFIINVKAIQGFSIEDMRRIVEVHATSLRTGRQALFDTINVQGLLRDQLEQALEDAGFKVPLASLDRWYRRALEETGIPNILML